MNDKLRIVEVSLDHLDDLVSLFDQYRIFYKQASDKNAAATFLKERIEKKESIVFLAYLENIAVGFTQLYPSFSSVSMQRSMILNDLYVNEKARSKGVANALLKKAQTHATDNKMKGLALETAKDNPAQKLYEKLCWEKDEDYLHYFWSSIKN